MAAPRAVAFAFALAVTSAAAASAGRLRGFLDGASTGALEPSSRLDEGGRTPRQTPPPLVEKSTWDSCECGREACVCVMYYLCDPHTHTVYTYGEEVLDERFQLDKVTVCPGTLQTCCKVPRGVSPMLPAVPGGANGTEPGGATAGGCPPTTQEYPYESNNPECSSQPPVSPPLNPLQPSEGGADDNWDRQKFPPEGTSESPALPPALPPPPRPLPPRPSHPQPSAWECGVRRTDFAVLDVWTRIDGRGEDEVAFAEFPWMLVVLRASNGLPLGGASLIRPDVALTAAHSVKTVEALEMVVRAGEWDASRTDEPLPHQERVVVRKAEHPLFVRKALHYDAALLFLEAPFEAAPHVAPICLPPSTAASADDLLLGPAPDAPDAHGAAPGSEPFSAASGKRCLATGWGTDKFGKGEFRHLLRRVDLPVVPRDRCQSLLRNTRLGFYFFLHESFMCAGGLADRDTCKGDGGGPLVCQSREDPRRYEQVGIVSWGIGCAEAEVPAVYTDVTRLRPWLDEELASDPPGLPPPPRQRRGLAAEAKQQTHELRT